MFLGGFGGSDPKVMGTIETNLSIWLIWHLRKSNQTDGYEDVRVQIKKIPKNNKIFLVLIFTTMVADDPKVMGTIETSSSGKLF